MFSFLAKLILKDQHDTDSPRTRETYGMLSGLMGILLNLLLCAGKMFAGVTSGSIATTADAFNNLSDAGSSVITLVGFRLAGKKPDPDHPFGHGRAEYITGLLISIVIAMLGVELLRGSIDKIRMPQPVEFSALTFAILAVSILVKLYMWHYNRALAKKLNSPAMSATAADSLSDSIATAAVLLSMAVGHFTGWMIDGWCGLAVSCFIFMAGFRAAKETIEPLLGRAPDRELIQAIEAIVLSYSEIIGIHDLIVHDYGPGRKVISLHAEVPATGDLLQLHDTIDLAERSLQEKLNCTAVIHMDPIDDTDPFLVEFIKPALLETLRSKVSPEISVHDLRMVSGPTHTNLIFDVLLPVDCPVSDGEVARIAREFVESLPGNYFAVVQIDHAYV